MSGRRTSSGNRAQDSRREVASLASVWIAVAIGVVALGVGIGVGWALHPSSTGSDQALTQPSPEAIGSDSLSNQKTRADIQLEQAQRLQALRQADATQAGNVWWRQVIAPGASVLAAAITGLVAYLAIVLPLRRQRDKDREQRDDAAVKDREQRKDALKRDVEQRQKDRVQRFDAGFAAAVSALGNDNAAIQAGGAAALQSYLRPDLDEFLDQVYTVVRANLDQEIEHPDPVRRLLVVALSKALSKSPPASRGRAIPRTHSIGRGDGPNLSRTWMRGADFRGLDLSSADVAFSDLQNARLDGAALRRSWGWGVNLEGATLRSADLEEARYRAAFAPNATFDDACLVSARFEGAELSGARFRAAKLQSAHFSGAQLDQADFRNADVRDTFFDGATFDLDSLGTLLLTSTWRALSSAEASSDEHNRAELLMRRSLDKKPADQLMALARRRWSGTGSAPKDAPTRKIGPVPDAPTD
jgi:uncharacterized protein YjbI with pentapeptide repeats